MEQTSAEGLRPSRIAMLVGKMSPFMLVLGLLFVTTFNLQPEPMRLSLTLFFGTYLVLSVIAIMGLKATGQGLGAIAFVGFIILNVIHIVLLGRFDTAYTFSQYLFSFLASTILFFPTIFFFSRRSLGLLYLAVLAVFGLALFQAYYFDPLVVGTPRLAPFNGGDETLHPSAYAVLGFLTFFALVHHTLEPALRMVNLFVVLVAIVTLEFYGVRTTHLAIMVVGLVYTTIALGLHYKIPLGNLIFLLVVFIIPVIVVGVLYFFINSHEFSQFLSSYSSGRTVAYLDRLEIFSERTWFDKLIGLGAGSDIMAGINVWTWEAKDSHNDFLSFLLEYGVVGFFIFIIWCLSLILSSRSIREIAIISGLIVASAISNGLLLRPTLFILFALAIALGRSTERMAVARQRRPVGNLAPMPRLPAASRYS